ncbi:MAG: type II secretion system protein [Candidatus Moranbacteria bacterium]|nr:type II secretion system protein [Candidatus Moranbacteria bacterium]
MKNKNKKGFTLLEILLVVATIAILAGIVIIAINPSKQLADTQNAQRWSDVNAILNGVYQYSVDNNGSLPANITNTDTEICKTDASCSGLIDLSVLTDDEKYLVAIPFDPTGSSTNGGGYEISKSSNGRITVIAPDAVDETVSVKR